ncbi:hypothetical protein HYW40_00680 [Candidatus Curtissbacteria bacterium]|nr:hypothetical protein [Candidatus Curtissbacteria bacterium]
MIGSVWKKYKVYIVSFFSLSLFVAAILGLWQLQPQAPLQTVLSEKSQTSPLPPESQGFEPKDGSVTSDKTVKFKGKMLPDSLIFIISSDFQLTAKADASGAFEKEVTLSSGLNLIDIISVSGDLAKELRKSTALYLADDNTASAVAAGSVKTIFDNVITVSALNSQITVRTSSLTDIVFPQDAAQKESTESAKDIRVGDYLVALGDAKDADTIAAKKITIIRDNKPQNNEVLSSVKILTAPKLNLFTAKTNKDAKILELTLTKTTQGLLDGKEAQVTDIQKDKNAVIIYHEGGTKKIVDLVYLLP